MRIWIWLLWKVNITKCALGSSGMESPGLVVKTVCCEMQGGGNAEEQQRAGPCAELTGSTMVVLKVEINLKKKKKLKRIFSLILVTFRLF